MKFVGTKFHPSVLDSCKKFMHRPHGRPVGSLSKHIDYIIGCGESGVFDPVQRHPTRRFGTFELLEMTFTRVGAELPQDKDLPVAATQ